MGLHILLLLILCRSNTCRQAGLVGSTRWREIAPACRRYALCFGGLGARSVPLERSPLNYCLYTLQLHRWRKTGSLN